MRASYQNHKIDPVNPIWINAYETQRLNYPFHYHSSEFELTLVLGGHGIRFVGDNISHALLALDPEYTHVQGYVEGGTQTWIRTRPSVLNDLVNLLPQRGYWVNLENASVLTYPTGGYSLAKMVASDKREYTSVQSQPQSCDFWAYQPGLLVPGDTIRAYDQSGVLCGDTTVIAEGGFLLHVTGDDNQTEQDEGADPGEKITFTINGQEVFVKGTSENFSDVILQGKVPVFEQMGNKRIEFDLNNTVVNQDEIGPDGFNMFPNYPNPFNGDTVIQFYLPAASKVNLFIVDTRGRMVRRLLTGIDCGAGHHSVQWRCLSDGGEEVATGVYFTVISVLGASNQIVQKMIYLK